MKKLRFHPPYRSNGRTTFPESRRRKGVYLIKVNDQLRYVGHSGYDLYKTMYRHFQSWQDPRQVRVSYQGHLKNPALRVTVRLVYTNTARQAAALERALILRYRPKDNPDKLELFQPTRAESEHMAEMLDRYENQPAQSIYDDLPF